MDSPVSPRPEKGAGVHSLPAVQGRDDVTPKPRRQWIEVEVQFQFDVAVGCAGRDENQFETLINTSGAIIEQKRSVGDFYRPM